MRLAAKFLTAAVLCAAATVVVTAAYREFPLTITFAALADPASGMTADETFANRSEGRVPVVLMNRSGQIQLDTRGSSQTICFNFGGAIIVDLPAVAPADGCYPVLLRTLIRPGTVQVSDLSDGETLDFGMDVYWTGPGQDGRAYDYVVEYKRVEGNGVDVSYSAGTNASENTWTVAGVRPGRISVYRKGKVSGWSVVGTYDLPVQFTAVRGS
jgi:hypothetical protein